MALPLISNIFSPKKAQAQSNPSVGFGTGLVNTPNPAPTPFQSSAKGGNPYIVPPTNPNSGAGPYVNPSARPSGSVNGVTTFNNGTQLKTANTYKSIPTDTQRVGDVNPGNLSSLYPGYAGWDPNAAWQDFLATGGSGKSAGSGNGGGGGNGGNGGGSGQEIRRPSKEDILSNSSNWVNNNINVNDPYAALEAAAAAGDEAAYNQILSEYQTLNDQLDMQYGEADTNEKLAQEEIMGQLSKAKGTTEKQKLETESQRDRSIGEAGNIARETQRTNRNVLRALGILGSTYAADALQKPMNQFDTERARLVTIANQRSNELDDAYVETEKEATRQSNAVKTQYQQIKDRIRADQRFNEREKIGALSQAKAAAQQRLAEIQLNKTNYQDQITSAKQQFASNFASILKQQQPSAKLSDIMAQSIAFANQFYSPSNQQVAIANSPTPARLSTIYDDRRQ